eukprot:jgi/Bigna1/89093/estExt_fgenesh1_pg.C_430094
MGDIGKRKSAGGGEDQGKKKRKKNKRKSKGNKSKKSLISSSQEDIQPLPSSSSTSLTRKPSEHTFAQGDTFGCLTPPRVQKNGINDRNGSSETSKRRGRKFTVSENNTNDIVTHDFGKQHPGLCNAQSSELRTYLVGQIARALTIFEVDEGSSKRSDPNVFMARVLQYLETPQYLRKELFPMHPDLRFAGLLNPLDAPHHVRMDTPSPYREGIVARRPTKPGSGVWVNVGLRQCALVGMNIPAGTRVTVKLPLPPKNGQYPRTLRGNAVDPTKPRTQDGIYWGYTTRLAGGLGKVLSECPFKGGYDLTIGTSERGLDAAASKFKLPTFRHMLIVFGGLGGLEDALEGDESLAQADPSSLFSLYINSCTHQGSRTIRTEEAVPITLSLLRPHILRNGLI